MEACWRSITQSFIFQCLEQAEPNRLDCTGLCKKTRAIKRASSLVFHRPSSKASGTTSSRALFQWLNKFLLFNMETSILSAAFTRPFHCSSFYHWRTFEPFFWSQQCNRISCSIQHFSKKFFFTALGLAKMLEDHLTLLKGKEILDEIVLRADLLALSLQAIQKIPWYSTRMSHRLLDSMRCGLQWFLVCCEFTAILSSTHSLLFTEHLSMSH